MWEGRGFINRCREGEKGIISELITRQYRVINIQVFQETRKLFKSLAHPISVTWKRLNRETTQHGHGSKIIFEAFPFFLKF